MMGRLNHQQEQLFYSFCLDKAVPDDHLLRVVGVRGAWRTIIKDRSAVDRSGADDPDTHHRLLFAIRRRLRSSA